VDAAGAVTLQRVPVIAGSISDIRGEPILLVTLVVAAHGRVPVDLRHDGGRRHALGHRIRLLDRQARPPQPPDPEGVDQDVIRIATQPSQGMAQGLDVGRFEPVPVDRPRVNPHDRDGLCHLTDLLIEASQLELRAQLRVPQPGDLGVGGQDDRRRNQGARQGASPDLVAPGHVLEPGLVEAGLHEAFCLEHHRAECTPDPLSKRGLCFGQ
jgi:hypothetical protein